MTAPRTVTVGVLTYRRPVTLVALLDELDRQRRQVQERRPGTEVEVLVVDNDPAASAAAAVEARRTPGLRYVHEPRPGIAAARNRVLDETVDRGVLVFVDDDERPHPGWLAALLDTHEGCGAQVVAGAVTSVFAGPVPTRLVEAGFFRRRRLDTGTPITVAATNNLLLDRGWVAGVGLSFDERFGLSGGEDTHFTRRAARAGAVMVWCDEAVVDDVVPADRAALEWVLRRAYSSGNADVAVDVALRPGTLGRTSARLGGVARGLVRAVGGAARWALGTVLGRQLLRDRGARTLARGAGMVAGAAGRVYLEYGRPSASR